MCQCSLPRIYQQNQTFNILFNFPPKGGKSLLCTVCIFKTGGEPSLLHYISVKHPLAWPFITHSVGRFRCYLPRRNNEEVFKYWLWLWKRGAFFSPLSQFGSRLNLDAMFALSICSADLGSFPATIWAWRSSSDIVIKGGGSLPLSHALKFLLWNQCLHSWNTDLTHSTHTKCCTYTTLKGIHLFFEHSVKLLCDYVVRKFKEKKKNQIRTKTGKRRMTPKWKQTKQVLLIITNI